MIHRDRVVGVVALAALSSLGMASACGVGGGIEGASSSGTGGSAGTSGTSGSTGTSGSAGTSGSSNGDAAPITDVMELPESSGLTSLAVGANKIVFVESIELKWCEAPACDGKIGVSNPPGPAPTTVTFGDGKFYGAFGTQLRACEVKPNEVDCNGGDTMTDGTLTNATRLRYDGTTFVWIQNGNVMWRPPGGGGGVQSLSGTSGQHAGLALSTNRAFFTEVGTAGRVWAIDDASAGSAKRQVTSNVLEPGDIVADGTSIFVVARGNVGVANGYVQRCNIDGSNCSKPLENLESPSGIAMDATHLYVSDTGRNRVLRVFRAGGPAVPIALGLERPTEIVLDDAYAYVVANDATGKKRGYRVKKMP